MSLNWRIDRSIKLLSCISSLLENFICFSGLHSLVCPNYKQCSSVMEDLVYSVLQFFLSSILSQTQVLYEH